MILLTNLVACKCDDPSNPDCKNYNPCHNKQVTNASFNGVIKGNFRNLDMNDTVTAYNVFIFSAHQSFDTYKWKIGLDTNTWTSPKFEIGITNPVGTIPVTLIAQRSPDQSCFPSDDGIDTFTRKITVVDRKFSKAYGKWQGALESNPQDTFTINLFISDTTVSGPFPIQKGYSYISNFPKGYSYLVIFYPQYTGLYYEDIAGIDPACQCAASYLYGKIIDEHTIEIEFKGWNNASTTYIPQKFMGKRQ